MAAPNPPGSPDYLAADPSVALAQALAARNITSLDGWLQAQLALAGVNARIQNSRLSRSFGDARDSLLSNLAARGMTRSGDLGYQQGRLAQDFADKRYDLNSRILQGMANTQGQYLKRKTGNRDNIWQAYFKAFGQAGANPGVLPDAPPAANTPPAAPTPKPYKTSVPWSR